MFNRLRLLTAVALCLSGSACAGCLWTATASASTSERVTEVLKAPRVPLAPHASGTQTIDGWNEYQMAETGLPDLSCDQLGDLCAAAEANNEIDVSTDPASGFGTWTHFKVSTSSQVGMRYVSCPSSALCVAVDNLGNVYTSTTPATGGWQSAAAKAVAVSCPSTSLCVLLQYQPSAGSGMNGTYDTVVSADPGDPNSYSQDEEELDTANLAFEPRTFTCAPGSTQCTVIGAYGDCPAGASVPCGNGEFATTNPNVLSGGWGEAIQVTTSTTTTTIGNLACPITQLCVLGDPSGLSLVSTNPAANTWSPAPSGVTPQSLTNVQSVFCAETTPNPCLRVFYNGDIETSPSGAGTSWGAPTDIEQPVGQTPAGNPESMSCDALGSLCIIGDQQGNILVKGCDTLPNNTSGTATTADRTGHDTTPGPCQLTVNTYGFTTGDTSEGEGVGDVNSGYAFGDGFVGMLSQRDDELFAHVPGVDGGVEFKRRCLGGCVDVAVRVSDPNQEGQPVTNATVTATLTNIVLKAKERDDYPDSIQPPAAGNGIICTLDGTGDCGTTVTENITGGDQGVATFQYFMPGVVFPDPHYAFAKESIQFTAKSHDCLSFGCLLGPKGTGELIEDLHPRIWVDRTLRVTPAEIDGLEQVIAGNATAKAKTQKRLDNVFQMLKDAGVLDEKSLDAIEHLATISQSKEVDQLLHRDPDTVMLDWFMGKFGIASDGLLSGNFDIRAYAQQLRPLLVDFLTKKLTGNKLIARFEDQIHAKLDAITESIVKDSFTEQVIPLVKKMVEKEHAVGRAGTATLKLYDVSYCTGHCELQPLPVITDRLYMGFSESIGGGDDFYAVSDPALKFTAQGWIPAQCKAPYRCEKDDTG